MNAAGEARSGGVCHVAERLEDRDRVEYLTGLLRAVARVNEAISGETRRDRLLQRTCETLLETRPYESAWVAVLDESGNPVAAAQAGPGDAFGGMLENMRRAELPACARDALERSGQVIVTSDDGESMTIALEHGGAVCGVMSVCVPVGMASDAEEQWGLRRVARAVTLGLQGIEAETKRRCAEEALHASKEQLEEANRRLTENQSQLVQSEKMACIGQLAAGIAHEINNPVGFVMSNIGTLTGYVAAMKKMLDQYEELARAVRREDGTRHTDVLDRIGETRRREELAYIMADIDKLLAESIDGTGRIRDIVQNLKNFARTDDEQAKLANINDGIEATLKIVWNELKYKCAVHKRLGDIPPIRCNPGQLNQVFLNLLVNAAQAILEHGDVTISTEAVDGCVVVRVSDTGRGIRPEHLPKIFDPFFTTKQAGKGTGLGLLISQEIVQRHNGTIEVESELGRGTTFTVRLPITEVKDD